MITVPQTALPPTDALKPTRQQIIRCAGVMALTGISSKSTLYRWISEGRFPKSVKLGPRASGWFLADVDAWVNSRKAG